MLKTVYIVYTIVRICQYKNDYTDFKRDYTDLICVIIIYLQYKNYAASRAFLRPLLISTSLCRSTAAALGNNIIVLLPLS